MFGIKVCLIYLIFAVSIFSRKMVDGEKSQPGYIPNFGAYDIDVESFTQCKGPKKKNISENIYEPVRQGRNIIIYGNKTNKETVGPAEAKVKILKWSGKRFESMITHKSENACEFKLITELVWKKFNNFDENCNIVKGIVEIKDVDLAAITRHLIGNRYFYGKYKNIVQFYYKNYNIECIETIVSYNPK